MLVKAVARIPEQHLHRRTQQKYCAQVAGAAGGMAAALGDHVGEDRESDAPEDARDAQAREQKQSDMIHGHAQQSDQLQGVGAQAGESFHGFILASKYGWLAILLYIAPDEKVKQIPALRRRMQGRGGFSVRVCYNGTER